MIIQPTSKKKKRRRSSSMVISRRSPRKKKRALLIKRIGGVFASRFAIFIFLLLILLGGFSYFLFISDQFLLTDIKVEGINEELEEKTRSYFQERASEKKFFLLKRDNALLFPEEDFQKNVLKVVPEIKNVQTEIQLPHSLTITAEEREQKGIWCNYHNLVTTQECYFYDTEGVIYEKAPNSARGTLITLVRDTRVEKAELADEVLSVEFIEYVDSLTKALGAVYQKPIYVKIHNEQELHLGFLEGWEAYVNYEDSSTEQAENIAFILEEEVKERSGALQYMDLRLGNKVYLKYKE